MLAEGKEEVKQKNLSQPVKAQSNTTVKLAMTAVMSALIAVTTITAIPMPPPLSTLTFAPIIIFVVGILMGPFPALVSASIGSALGFLAGASIGSIMVPPGFMGVFLLGIVVSRGPMGATVGLLRNVNEVAAMVIAVLVETAIFFLMDWGLFGLGMALLTLGTLVDLVFVPIGYIVLKVVKRMWDVSLLE
jgi:uncharacterized membrane protein